MKTKKTHLFKEANSLIAKNLKRLAAKKGMSLERLAFDSDLDKGNLYNAINGKINFTLRTVVKTSETLGVEITELFRK